MDLFTPVVPIDRQHKHFRRVLGYQFQSRRAVVQQWADGFPDRDGKLMQEFQQSFNSTFWEIYLYAVFKEYGFTFDWSRPSPDFTIHRSGLQLCIEAVTANAAQGQTPEWEAALSAQAFPLDLWKLNREAMIRIANAMHSKHKKYLDSYGKLRDVSKHPFVLALAPFEQPFFNHQYNRPIKAVLYDLYVDEPAYQADPDAYPDGPPSRTLSFVTKDNGADIELGLFKDDRMREISAVMFSCTATWGKVDALAPEQDRGTIIQTIWGSDDPRKPNYKAGHPNQLGEVLTDGLQIYHNPFALHPLDPIIFRKPGVVQFYFDRSRGDWVEEELYRALFFRQSWNILPVSDAEFDAEPG